MQPSWLGAVKYTDCISAKEYTPATISVLDMTLNYEVNKILLGYLFNLGFGFRYLTSWFLNFLVSSCLRRLQLKKRKEAKRGDTFLVLTLFLVSIPILWARKFFPIPNVMVPSPRQGVKNILVVFWLICPNLVFLVISPFGAFCC